MDWPPTKKLSRQLKTLFDLQLITKLRSNMKNQLLPMADKLLLRKRALIETIIDQLKNISQIEHTRHRSPVNIYGPSPRWINCLLPPTEKTSPKNRVTAPSRGRLTRTHVQVKTYAYGDSIGKERVRTSMSRWVSPPPWRTPRVGDTSR